MNKPITRTTAFLLATAIIAIGSGQSHANNYQAAAIFLLISPSTTANSMGQAFSPLSGDDTFQSYFFPASWGDNYGSYSKLTSVDWLPEFGFNDLNYEAAAYQCGFRFRMNEQQNLSLFLGLYDILLDMEASAENWDKVQSLRGGARWEIDRNRDLMGKFTLGLGLGSDHIWNYLSFLHNKESSATTWDWGVAATTRALTTGEILVFNWDLGFQIAQTFIGDKMRQDLLPRQAHFGLGTAFEWTWNSMTIARIHLAAGRSCGLINHGEYQSFPGELFNWDNSEEVENRLGLEITGGDCLSLRLGKFHDDDGKVHMTTRGWGIQSRGIQRGLMMMTPASRSRVLAYVMTRLNIYYNNSHWDAGENHPCTDTLQHEFGLNFRF